MQATKQSQKRTAKQSQMNVLAQDQEGVTMQALKAPRKRCPTGAELRSAVLNCDFDWLKGALTYYEQHWPATPTRGCPVLSSVTHVAASVLLSMAAVQQDCHRLHIDIGLLLIERLGPSVDVLPLMSALAETKVVRESFGGQVPSGLLRDLEQSNAATAVMPIEKLSRSDFCALVKQLRDGCDTLFFPANVNRAILRRAYELEMREKPLFGGMLFALMGCYLIGD